MGETEWKHAGWVSGLGKWAWIVLFVTAIISLIFGLIGLVGTIAAWEALRPYYTLIGQPMPPIPIGGFIWTIIGVVLSLFVSIIIIRPKFSKPCGAKDWEALYGWTLKLGGSKVPWMFIWGVILVIFGWLYWPAIFVLLPAIMLIFAGPRKYEWK